MSIERGCDCPCSTQWYRKKINSPSTDYHYEGFCVGDVNCGTETKYRGYGQLGSPTPGECGTYDAISYVLEFTLQKCKGEVQGEFDPAPAFANVKSMGLPINTDEVYINIDVTPTVGDNIIVTGIPVDDFGIVYDEFGRFVWETTKVSIAFVNSGVPSDDTRICYSVKHELCIPLDSGLEPATQWGSEENCDECPELGGENKKNFFNQSYSCPKSICISESPKADGSVCPPNGFGADYSNTIKQKDHVEIIQSFYPPQSSVNPN